MAIALLQSDILEQLATTLPQWSQVDGSLKRVFKTGNFVNGLILLNAIGYLAEKIDHHPDIELTYPQLIVRLKTHDVDGITEKDFALASAINSLPGL